MTSGEYVIFLDSDDIFLPEMIKSMSETLDCNSEADICISNFVMQDINTEETSFICAGECKPITDKVFKMDELDEGGLSCFMPTPWDRMIRRSFLTEHSIRFQNLTNCNDMFFGYASVIGARGIVYNGKRDPMMVYRVNSPKQISYNMDSRNMSAAFERLLDWGGDVLKKNDVLMHQIMAALVSGLKPMLSRCPNEIFNRDCIKRTIAILNENTYDNYFESDEYNYQRNDIINMGG